MALVCAGCEAAAGKPSEPAAGRSEAVYDGENDTTPFPRDRPSQYRRDAVVFVNGPSCTGTLITPRVVVTAYHCVDDRYPPFVTFGPQRPPGSTSFDPPPYMAQVMWCLPHPYARDDGRIARCNDGGTRRKSHDVALLILDERVDRGPGAVPRTANFPALPMELAERDPFLEEIPDPDDLRWTRFPTDDLSSPFHWLGQRARIAGYGSVAEDRDATVNPGIRQFADVTIDGAGAEFLFAPYRGRRGDSGAPYYVGDPDLGPVRLMGIHRGPQFRLFTDNDAQIVRVTRQNIWDWVQAIIERDIFGSSLGPVSFPPVPEPERAGFEPFANLLDPDGDGIVSSRDNCPLLANAEQDDADRDGLGDTCDFCPTASVIGVDADDDLVDDGCDNCLGDFNPAQRDDDGDGVGNICDSCPNRENRRQLNCNLVAEEAAGVPSRGDACDPVPCPHTTSGEVTDDAADGTGDLLVSNRQLTSTGAVAEDGANGRFSTGWRFCNCLDARAGDTESWDSCRIGASSSADCAVDVAGFGDPMRADWDPMTLTDESIGASSCGSDPSLGDLRCLIDYAGHAGSSFSRDDVTLAWDFVTDADRLGYSTSPGSSTRFERILNGVLWSHAVPPAGRFDEELASEYRSHTVVQARVPSGEPGPAGGVPGGGRLPPSFLPMAPAAFDPGICIFCDAAQRQPWLMSPLCLADDTCVDEQPVALTPSIALPLDALAATPDMFSQAGLVWMAPAEPRWAWHPNTPRLVALSGNGRDLAAAADGELGEFFAINPIPDLPNEALDASGDPITDPVIPGVVRPSRVRFGALYRASAGDVIVVGGLDPSGRQLDDGWKLTIHDQTWRPLPIGLPFGEGLGAVLATAYDPRTQVVYALVHRTPEPAEAGSETDDSSPGPELDRRRRRSPHTGSTTTLWALHLDGAQSEILIRWNRAPRLDRHALVLDERGRLILVASGPAPVFFAVRFTPAEHLSVDGFLAGRGHLESRAYLDESGVAFVVSEGRRHGLRVAGFDHDEMRPPGARGVGSCL